MDRTEKIFHKIDRGALGVEIGPSHRPLAPKKGGFKVITVDHASAEDLKAKYATHGLDLSQIESVDVVVKNGRFSDEVGPSRVEWVIASHVFEHAPDFIGFLLECEKVLKVGGVLSIALPDFRCCFDVFRGLSNTGEMLEAWKNGNRVHESGAVFDHVSRAARLQGDIGWSIDRTMILSQLEFVHDLNYAKSLWGKAKDGAEYIDIHRWRFTPASFKLVMLELRALGIVALEELSSFGTTAEGEFFVTLRKGSSAGASLPDRKQLDQMRLALLKDVYREVADSASQAVCGFRISHLERKPWLAKIVRRLVQ